MALKLKAIKLAPGKGTYYSKINFGKRIPKRIWTLHEIGWFNCRFDRDSNIPSRQIAE